MPSNHTFDEKQTRIVIVGAGVAGVSLGIALKQRLGFEKFTIFEKAYSVGGTWRDNIYPGCSSDIPVHFYSLSTDLKPDWSCSHPFQPEILAYWNRLSEKYSIPPHIVFGRKVIAARWSIKEQLYHISTEDVKTGEQFSTTAHILVSAVGIIEVPKFPEIPGMSGFRGPIFHSAQWLDMELGNKTVAVIGNGASATQFVPIISKQPNIHVTQFCRTPNWVLPPIRNWFSSSRKWLFKYIPLFMRAYRFIIFLQTELSYFSIFHSTMLRSILAKMFKNHILRNAPAKYHDRLIPNYALGCKRVIFDTDYLSALHQKNIELNWQGVASIVGDGIITKTGEHLPFDVIILATGFTADKYPLLVEGAGGQTIQEYHNSQGGPTAYLGTSTPGFPNFYMIGGPNTATGHTSVIFTEEVQINYILKLIKPILQREVTSLDVTSGATDGYNAKIQARLSRSVFINCFSWYRVDGTGKINSMFPGPAALFWWWLRRPNWEHYQAEGSTTDRWAGDGKTTWSVGVALTVLGIMGAWIVF